MPYFWFYIDSTNKGMTLGPFYCTQDNAVQIFRSVPAVDFGGRIFRYDHDRWTETYLHSSSL